MFNAFIGKMKYTRNELYRLDKPFKFYGPIHEFIVCDDKNITSGLFDGLHVNVSMDGSSWQGDVSDKYLSHSHTLEKYINKDRSDPRWIFYCAQSYHNSLSPAQTRSNAFPFYPTKCSIHPGRRQYPEIHQTIHVQ